MKILIQFPEKLNDSQRKFLKQTTLLKCEELTKSRSELLPMTFLLCSDSGESNVLVHPFTDKGTDYQKKAMSELINHMVNKYTAIDTVLFASESWVLENNKETIERVQSDLQSGKIQSIESHPETREVLMISFETETGQWHGSSFITRDSENRPVLEDTFKFRFVRDETASGIFTNFLKHRRINNA